MKMNPGIFFHIYLERIKYMKIIQYHFTPFDHMWNFIYMHVYVCTVDSYHDQETERSWVVRRTSERKKYKQR